MTTYNHAFSVSFIVPDSNEFNGDDCVEKELEKVLRGLAARIEDLRKNPGDAVNAVENLHDTYEK